MMLCGECIRELSNDEAYYERALESDVVGRLNALLEVFICLHVYLCAPWARVCMCVCMCVCVRTHVRMCVHVSVYVCLCVCMSLCVRISICACIKCDV